MNQLAIIIPYYKIDFFEETLKSLADQTNKDFTLYIGNDASKENPMPIIEKYFSSGDYHYYDYKTNLGSKDLTAQWERILENVKEEWFQILGDDDMVSENFVETFYHNLDKVSTLKISVIKFLFDWIDEKGIPFKINNYKTDFIKAEDLIQKKYLGETNSSLSENIFRINIYKKYKFEKIPLAWGTDDLAIYQFANNKPILFIKEAKVSVRIFENSISGSANLQVEKGNAYNIFREKLISKHGSKFPKEFISKVMEDYLNWCYLKKQKVNSWVLLYNLKKMDFVKLLKNAKRIYYIKKKLKS